MHITGNQSIGSPERHGITPLKPSVCPSAYDLNNWIFVWQYFLPDSKPTQKSICLSVRVAYCAGTQLFPTDLFFSSIAPSGHRNKFSMSAQNARQKINDYTHGTIMFYDGHFFVSLHFYSSSFAIFHCSVRPEMDGQETCNFLVLLLAQMRLPIRCRNDDTYLLSFEFYPIVSFPFPMPLFLSLLVSFPLFRWLLLLIFGFFGKENVFISPLV